jgi:hypothetical protein
MREHVELVLGDHGQGSRGVAFGKQKLQKQLSVKSAPRQFLITSRPSREGPPAQQQELN